MALIQASAVKQKGPLFRALDCCDSGKLAPILNRHPRIQSYFQSNDIRGDDIVVTKTIGEAFTGGRSTPVLNIHYKNENALVAKVIDIEKEAMDNARGEQLVLSYALETKFYLNFSQLFLDNIDDVRIPRCFICKSFPNEGRFIMVFDDLRKTHPRHPTFLSVNEAKLALEWVAKFHATLAMTPTRNEVLAAAKARKIHNCPVWHSACFWTLSKSAKLHPLSNILRTWQQNMKFVSKKFPGIAKFSSSGFAKFGERLLLFAPVLNAFIHPTDSMESKWKQCFKRNEKFLTIIHGDLKAANLFFNTVSCAGLDFQFSGLGLPCCDVAYLLFPDALGDFFVAEEELISHYYNTIIERWPVMAGKSLKGFHLECQLARLDFVRYCLMKGWVACSERDVQLLQKVNETMNMLDDGEQLSSEEEYMEYLLQMMNY